MENVDKPSGKQSQENSKQEKVSRNERVIGTFSFNDPDSEGVLRGLFSKELDTLDLETLEGLNFVNLETVGEKYKDRAQLEGLEDAQNLIDQNNDSKILLFGFTGLDRIRGMKPKIDLVLARKNVRFIRLPFTPQQAIEIFKSEQTENIDMEKLTEIQDREISGKVGQLIHMIHISSPDELSNLRPDDAERLPKMIAESKKYFPALQDKRDQEIVQFLFSLRQNVPEVMKGQNIEGVFCDIEGTLFNGEELNRDTLLKLEEFEKEGKRITLWTDGDVTQLQELLEKNNVKYPLKSKIDFAGACAEIVIDNDDNNTFSGKTKIFAKTFIKV